MGLTTALRFSMTNTGEPGADHTERYQAALDMAAYADEHGFTGVSCEEHHLAATGWLPSPLIMASALAARTRTVRISVAAAKRAARLGLPFSPPMAMPAVEAVYTQELKRHDKTGFVYRPENDSTVTLLHHDPDAAWKTYGCYIMNEVNEYSAWKRSDTPRPGEEAPTSIEHLRTLNNVEILTPQQLIDQIVSGRKEIVMNPLVGGLPPDEGWASLQLLGSEVLPRIAKHRSTLPGDGSSAGRSP